MTGSESRSLPDYNPLYLAGYMEEWAAHIESSPDREVPSTKLGGEILSAAAKHLRAFEKSSETTSLLSGLRAALEIAEQYNGDNDAIRFLRNDLKDAILKNAAPQAVRPSAEPERVIGNLGGEPAVAAPSADKQWLDVATSMSRRLLDIAGAPESIVPISTDAEEFLANALRSTETSRMVSADSHSELPPMVYIVRASGEGVTDWKLCRTEAEIRAAYVSMVCGSDDEHHKEEIDGIMEAYRGDGWRGDTLLIDLYCATFTITRFPADCLDARPSAIVAQGEKT